MGDKEEILKIYKSTLESIKDSDKQIKDIIFNDIKINPFREDIVKEYHDVLVEIYDEEEIGILECELCSRTLFLRKDREKFNDEFLLKLILPDGGVEKSKIIDEDKSFYEVLYENRIYNIIVKEEK
jgi:hypothetical protein